MRAVLSFLLIGITVAQITVTSILGISADQCASPLVFGFQDICQTGPSQGHTLWLPSQSSAALPADIIAGTRIVTIFGTNFNQLPAGVLSLAEPQPGSLTPSCATPPPTGATTANGTPNPAGTELSFPLPTGNADPTAWNRVEFEINGNPFPLCLDGAFTGLYIGVAFDCNNAIEAQSCSVQRVRLDALPETDGFTAFQFLEIESRTQCCRQLQGLGTGVCFNPNAKSCCSDFVNAGTLQQPNERCCNAGTGTVAGPGDRCPCNGVNGDTDCPAPERCCLPFKYAEFDNDVVRATQVGECYSPAEERCCDTGAVYDPGVSQCCVINGLQSINIPCPCSNDTHCQGGQLEFRSLHMACCRQTEPSLFEADLADARACSIYSNFPTGDGIYSLQRCTGSCIDTRYQICCNGVACVKAYEKCCNSTCCNKFVGSCDIGLRSGTPGNPWNDNEFRVEYEQCTTIEALNPIKAFFVFVLPTYMLILTLGGLAIVLVFANKASNRSYNPIEQAMIVVAVIIIILAMTFYFSPMYKYGVLVVIAGLIVILSAAARIFALNAWALVIIVLALLFMVDPFPGNEFLNFTSFRNRQNGAIVPQAAGFLWAIEWFYADHAEQCVRYYDWFRLDNQLRDLDRFDNPEITTFGYCERGWIIALLVFAVVVIILLVLLFFLTLIALLLRFRKFAPAPVALEILKEPEVFVAPPVFIEQPVFIPPPPPPVFIEQPVFVAPPPVFCEPPPVFYEPPPVFYEPPPVFYEPPVFVEQQPVFCPPAPVFACDPAPVLYEQPFVSSFGAPLVVDQPFISSFPTTPVFLQ